MSHVSSKATLKSQKGLYIVVGLGLGLVVTICIIIWLAVTQERCSEPTQNDSLPSSLALKDISLNTKTKQLVIKRSGVDLLQGQLGIGLEYDVKDATECQSQDEQICLQFSDSHRTTMFNLTLASTENDITCHKIRWASDEKYIKDCYDYGEHVWYGAAEVNPQHWDVRKWDIPMQEFIPRDPWHPERYGGVQERYWLMSNGVSIYIRPDIPLWSSNNSTTKQLCLMAQTQDSIYKLPEDKLILEYEICQASNLTKLHISNSQKYWKLPTSHPDLNILIKPIWSTWAEYKKNINESLLNTYADRIVNYNLSIYQLEIDDDWTPAYGDWTFNTEKFPNAKSQVEELKRKVPSVSVWMHPFIDIRAKAFQTAVDQQYLLMSGKAPGLIKWWNPGLVGTLDFSNPQTYSWYLNKLNDLQRNFSIDSFKFDAGEFEWMPIGSSQNRTDGSPANYVGHYVKLAYESDSALRQEVRVGWRTQEYPVLVRMLDRWSIWDIENGLKTLIPTALTFGLLGYPFVLPDMIGGNAYNGRTVDEELFMRWLQVNLFLPAIQFSIPPWKFGNETIISATRDLLTLRESYTHVFNRTAREAKDFGYPMVRPMWWIAPDDSRTYSIDNQYLLGNDLLVAPILEQNATSRDIYIPAGRWKDRRDKIYEGPVLLSDYFADLWSLPLFERLEG